MNDENKVRFNRNDDERESPNFKGSIPKDDVQDFEKITKDLTDSVSQLVGSITKNIKPSLKGLLKLGSMGKKFEKFGEEIEKAIEESGLEDFGRNLEVTLRAKGDQKHRTEEEGKEKIHIHKNNLTDIPVRKGKEDIQSKVDEERIKKRIKGLIKLKHSVEPEKLAQILDIEYSEAEKLVYELAAQDIKGTLEENIFKIEQDPEEVISFLNEKIENL
jgi:hypothetical protein